MSQDLMPAAKIIFIDDEASILRSLERTTASMNAECVFTQSGKEALEIMSQEVFDIVVSDMRMPEMDGATLLSEVAQRYPETMRLVLTGHASEDMFMTAINEGRIWGFINKPWDQNELLVTLRQAIAAQQMIAERALLRRTVQRYTRHYKNGFMKFIGNSSAMQRVYNSIEHAAPSSAAVFITGPSGTGKELAAEAIHQLSKRKDRPFIPLNCAAIPSDLMESEIFGHVKGAFTGAVANRNGAASEADGGTLFLDELAEMDISLQAKILRFIQTGTFQKVGSSKLEKVDIRFVCATNQDPMIAIENKQLREDLYYRLSVVPINLPPLNERDDDANVLAQHFLEIFSKKESKSYAGFSSKAEKIIRNYPWPGNVRQLGNCIHSVVVLNEGPLVTEENLAQALQLGKEQIKQYLSAHIPNTDFDHRLGDTKAEVFNPATLENVSLINPKRDGAILPLSEVEKKAVEHAIDCCSGNVVKAAAALEVSPSTLYRKLQSWDSIPVNL